MGNKVIQKIKLDSTLLSRIEYFCDKNFFSLKEFDTLWKGIGFDDGDLRELETFLIVNPQYGKVISGTGGLRK